METRKKIEARHPRAMHSQAEKSMHHRAARAIRQWLIVFILLTAGAATATAASWEDRGTVDVNGVRYHLYYTDFGSASYYASVEAFVGSQEEVTILNKVKNGGYTYTVQWLSGYVYFILEIRTGTITSTSVRRINFEGNPNFFGAAGNPTFNCPNLQEVYFLGGAPSFSGNWSDIFGNRATNTVTAYAKGKTQAQCDALKTNNAVWSGFKDVKPYQETYSCTLSTYGTGEAFVVDLGDYSSFADAGALSLAKLLYIAKGSRISKTANLPSGKKYAVVYVDTDPAKIPNLTRNAEAVSVNTVTHGGVKYVYYTESNLQKNVYFHWGYTDNAVGVTLTNETNGAVFISELGDLSSFGSNGSTMKPHLLDQYGKGSKASKRLKNANYATVYVHSDPTKEPKLKVSYKNASGQYVTSYPTLSYVTRNNTEYAYYNLPNPTSYGYTYTWQTTDKQCIVSFTQKQLPDNAAKTGTVNITNGSTKKSFNTATKSYSFSQGTTMELDIPFDPAVQTLNSIKVGGENTAFLTENGHYKATIAVQQNNSLAVELIWNEPIEPDPVVLPEPIQRKPPKAMIVRSGEGEVVFKGKGYLEVGQNDYEWRDQVTMDCSDPVSTVTVPHLGMRNEVLDDTEWGFRVEMKPVQGEVLRSLRIGWIDTDEETNRPIMRWDDFLNNPDYSNSSYMSYDEATGTYVFEALGDEMNFPKGDYTILVDMGPETTEVESSKTFNFVRKGGEGQAWIYWEDQMRDFYFNEDGNYSVEIPNEQLTDVQLSLDIQEGETFRIFKDGEEITEQFQNNWSGDYGEYSAELETASATYTILIEKAKTETVQTIPFIDEVVKEICVTNWDTDGDGELSFVEAQDVTSLGGVFAQTSIETFDELKYFTGLTEIGNEEFWHCDELKKVTLPPTITSIGEDSFYGCPELQSIELPNTLVEIGSGAFTYSSLREIRIPANVLVLDYGFSDSSVELIVIDKGNPLYETGIYNNAIIEKETQTVVALCDNAPIPEGVRRLGDYFWMRGGYSVTQMVVPASVEEIGGGAFNTYLETLTMKRREPIAFNINFFFNQSNLPANCKLIVPFGTRDAYIAAGWTENIFKGGVVEDDSVLDVNGDGVINPQDALKVIEKYMDQ